VHIEALIGLGLQTAGEGRVSLPGLTAWRSERQVLIHLQERTFARPAGVELGLPGKAALESGYAVCLTSAEIAADNYNETKSRLDGSRVSGPFQLRPWRKEDAIRPVGRTEVYRVQSLLRRRRIPAWERVSWPVLEWHGHVVWVRGIGVCADWAAGPETRQAVVIAETG